MSEAKLEQENNSLYRRLRSVRQPAEAETYESDSTEVAVVVDIHHPFEAISPDEMKSNAINDEAVRESYGTALNFIRDVHEHAGYMHNVLTEQVNANIIETETQTNDAIEEIEAAVASIIAAVEQQGKRAKQQVLLIKEGRVAESERMQEQADTLLESNKSAIKNIVDEIEGGKSHQLKLEQERDEDIKTFNELVERKNHQEENLENAKRNLASFSEKLSEKEAFQDSLLEKEIALSVAERNERERLVKPEIEEFMSRVSAESEVSEGLPQGIAEAIESIKKNVEPSPELSRLLGELKTNDEKQRINTRSMAHLTDLISEAELHINSITEELEEITLKLMQLKTKIDGYWTKKALDLQAHSDDAVSVSKRFQTILKGGTSKAAKETLPLVLQHVNQNMEEYKRAIAAAPSDEYKTIDLPVIDISTFGSLRDYLDDENVPTLAQEHEIQRNIEQGADRLETMRTLGMKGILKARSFLTPGVQYELHSKDEEEENS